MALARVDPSQQALPSRELPDAARRAVRRPPRWRVPLALVTSSVFLLLSIANLCVPEPRGLKDQGDFFRLFGSFSPGPAGLPLWPEADDPAWSARFGPYLRYWRLDGELHGWLRPLSTSRLVYLPERLVARAFDGESFDLARNTALLLAASAVVVAAAMFVQMQLVAAATLAAVVLVFADFRVGVVLNSFYQEAGAYVFFLWLVCALFAWLARRTPALLAASLVLAGALALTKIVYAPSALLVLASIVVVAWRCAPRVRRPTALLALAIAAGVALVSMRLDETRDAFGADVAFNFVFTGALPIVPPEERGPYLARLGLAPELARLAGRSVYEAKHEPELESIKRQILRRGHTAAIAELVLQDPVAALRLLAHAIAETGSYDLAREGYTWRAADAAGEEPFAMRAWSDLRLRLLSGGPAYALAVLLLVGVAAGRRAWDDWTWFCLVLGSGLLLGSLAQAAIAILGNGTGDLLKHLYLANLTLDAALLLLAGGAARRWRWNRASRASMGSWRDPVR